MMILTNYLRLMKQINLNNLINNHQKCGDIFHHQNKKL